MEKIKKLISIEIHKPKKERKKQQLKRMLIECKDLKRIIKSIKRETIKFCPNCKHEIWEDSKLVAWGISTKSVEH